MVTFTAWQLAKIFICYTLIVLVVPALVFGNRFKGKSFAMRLFSYFTIGNLYIINLVYLLEIFHLSYKITLILLTVVPAFLCYMFANRHSTSKLAENTFVATERLARGTYGFKTWVLRTVTNMGKGIVSGVKNLWKSVYQNVPDIIFTVGILVACWFFFGSLVLKQYGYGASDIVVHNYWINGLDSNQMFISGVYPFGFHNIIYYLHQVFGFEVLDLLRVFWVITMMYTALMLVVLLRAIAKSRYIVYLGMLCFLALDICVSQATNRYYSALPQEYAMIFVPMGIYYAFEFFKYRKIEVDEIREKKREDRLAKKLAKENGQEIIFENNTQGKEKKKFNIFELNPSVYLMAGIAACVAITFTTHSFATIILALVYFGTAVGFCVRFFDFRYFFRVIISCIVGMIVASAPMGISLLFGNHLQASFDWEFNVIKGEEEKEQLYAGALLNGREIDQDLIDEIWEYKESVPVEVNGEVIYIKAAVNIANIEEEYAKAMSNKAEALGVSLEEILEEDAQNISDTEDEEIEEVELSGIQKLFSKIGDVFQKISLMYETQYELLLKKDFHNLVAWFIAAVILVGILGVCFIVAGSYDRGYVYLSFFVASLFLTIGFEGKMLGLPQLFDPSRIYGLSYYFLWIYPVLAIDGVLCLLLGLWEKKSSEITMYIMSALVMVGGTVAIFNSQLVRIPEHRIVYGTNGSIITVTNILQNEKDMTWTIVSANDENQTTAGHGYHYEITEFLRNMEYYYTDYVSENVFTKEIGFNPVSIPSEKVFFFIEKKPLDYAESGYEYSGSMTSDEAANNALSNGKGLVSYMEYNRNIVMSRMMAWASKFGEIFPNEFKIYYEDDEFICYEIDQNAYSLYNFAIDYGYNKTDFPEYHQSSVMSQEEDN